MRFVRFAIAAAALATLSSPAVAGYKLMPANTRVAIAKSALTVTPSRDWNRLGGRVGRNAESWTLDGLTLNDVTFYAGIENDRTLFREVGKKEKPLPRYSATMLAPDVVQLFEGSYRIANATSLFSVDGIEPATFAGHSGFRFHYTFTVQGEEVKRKGEANGAVVGGKLYMMTFEAPTIHYYDTFLESYRKMVGTAQIAAAAGKSRS